MSHAADTGVSKKITENFMKINGFTLIEVLVALLILAIGILGVARLQMTALRHTADVANQSQASYLLAAIAERMRANPEAAHWYAGTITRAACSAAPTPCGDRFGKEAGTCSAQQIASFDLWDVFCAGHGHTGEGYLPELRQLQIHCPGNNCDQHGDYHIEISWNSRAVDNRQSDQNIRRITLQVSPQ